MNKCTKIAIVATIIDVLPWVVLLEVLSLVVIGMVALNLSPPEWIDTILIAFMIMITIVFVIALIYEIYQTHKIQCR